MKIFGLIGKNLTHSYSKKYFNHKFKKENINARYLNFELNDISKFLDIISKKEIHGLNVTTPYKSSIIPFLDEVKIPAKSINSINTIEFKENKMIGHNTDLIGFTNSFINIAENRNKALILGNGGSAKTIRYALDQLNIHHETVSRNGRLNYAHLTEKSIRYYDIIINTTILGMFPNVKDLPDIPYKGLSRKHLLFDLIYNPEETAFLNIGKTKGCKIKNGSEMLNIQAEESWKIWSL